MDDRPWTNCIYSCTSLQKTFLMIPILYMLAIKVILILTKHAKIDPFSKWCSSREVKAGAEIILNVVLKKFKAHFEDGTSVSFFNESLLRIHIQ